MTYMGSEARSLDFFGEATPERETRPSFEVVEGAGLDHLERRGVSAQFLARLKAVAVACVVIAVVCIARIGVYSMAVGTLSQNEAMRSELKQASALEDDLRIQRSVLSSSQRIDRIATQSYGMVMASGAEKLDAGTTGTGSADDASADASAGDASEAADAADAVDDASDDAQAQKSSDEVADEVGQATQTQGDGSTAGANAADVDSLA